MNFSINAINQTDDLKTTKTGCLAVGIYENKKLSPAANTLDLDSEITAAAQSGDITGKPGSTLLLRAPKNLAAERVLLVGLGKEKGGSERDFKKVAEALAGALNTLGAEDAVIALPMGGKKNRIDSVIRDCVLAIYNKNYRSDKLKSKQEPSEAGAEDIVFAVSKQQAAQAETAVTNAVAIANGVELAKNLANAPGNVCTPSFLADTAQDIADAYQMEIEVLEHKQIEALKMGSFLSVAKGSDEPPRFIVLKYLAGKTGEAPTVLVGKGITFDSGGISLKPGASMDEMKYDMCGAATALGTIQAAAEIGLRINLIAIIPSCENMPSGRANKPGDIVTTMAGQTVEILNTDAEGRLILCDALTYAERFKPAAVIDIATLTGACVVALGKHNTGLFTRHDDAHDELAEELLSAGKATGDTAWRMPIEDVYQEQLKSNFADMANIGGQPAGSITAACFLERFTKKFTWAHLDIAGTAWNSGAAKGATGRPVPMLTEFLICRAPKARRK